MQGTLPKTFDFSYRIHIQEPKLAGFGDVNKWKKTQSPEKH